MAGNFSQRQFLLAKEVTAGTRVAPATVKWRGPAEGFDDLSTFQWVEENVGILTGPDRQYKPKILAQIKSPTVPATFEQINYILEAALKKVGTGAADGAGTGKIYDYPIPTTAIPTIQPYSIYAGDDNQVELGPYGYVDNFKFGGKAGEALMMEAVWQARQGLPNLYTASTIAFTNSHTITDSANGLAIFPVGAVIKTSSANNPGPFTVTTSTAGTLTVTETTVTEAAGSAFTLAETFSAVALPTVEEILFSNSNFYIDAIGGTMGTTLVSNSLLDGTVTCDPGWRPIWTGGNNSLAFAQLGFDKKKWKIALDLTFLHDGNVIAEKANWRNLVARQIRLQFVGSKLATAGTTYTYKTFNIDLVGKWTKFNPLGEQDGSNLVKATFEAKYDATPAATGDFKVVNALTALP